MSGEMLEYTKNKN